LIAAEAALIGVTVMIPARDAGPVGGQVLDLTDVEAFVQVGVS